MNEIKDIDEIEGESSTHKPDVMTSKKRGSYTLSIRFDMTQDMNPLFNALIEAGIPVSIEPHNDGSKTLEAFGSKEELEDIIDTYVCEPADKKYVFDLRDERF